MRAFEEFVCEAHRLLSDNAPRPLARRWRGIRVWHGRDAGPRGNRGKPAEFGVERAQTQTEDRQQNQEDANEAAELQGAVRRRKEISEQNSGTGICCGVRLQPSACGRTYRMVVLRKQVKVMQGQKKLFDDSPYFFYITNLPKKVTRMALSSL